MKTYPINQIKELLKKPLLHDGYSPLEAEHVMYEIIENELIGKRSFGLETFMRLLCYNRKHAITKTMIINTGATTLLDAGHKFAHAAFGLYFDDLVRTTKELGVHVVSIVNNTSFLTAGFPVRRLMDSNLIGLCFIQSSANAVGFEGVSKALIGTNPFAIGIMGEKEGVLYDTATSSMALATLNTKKTNTGTVDSNEVGIDEYGNKTAQYDQVKTLLPMGGERGLGFGIAIELLGTILGYAVGFGKEEKEYIADNAILVIALDPKHLQFNEYKERIDEFLHDIKEIAPAIHIPGKAYIELRKDLQSIELNENVVDLLTRM